MIKAEEGEVRVNGAAFEVIFECDHLIKSLIEDSPELITAVFYKNSEALKGAMSRCNRSKLDFIEHYIDHIEQVRKELQNEE